MWTCDKHTPNEYMCKCAHVKNIHMWNMIWCIQNKKRMNMAAEKKKYASLRVSEERKMALEKAALEIGYAIGKPTGWTDVAFYLIDEYLKDAIKDAKSKREKKI